MDHYNSHIQLDKKVIADVFANIRSDTKMLVFGLGYDSKMWYEGNQKRTMFIENKDEYIQLNINDIAASNIVKYDYKTTCASSCKMTDSEIEKFAVPERLLEAGPFDIILIDGPEGYTPEKPGRLLPCYWSTLLSKPGTIIYVDDANRPLETYCIQKYFHDKAKVDFVERDKCTKIIM